MVVEDNIKTYRQWFQIGMIQVKTKDMSVSNILLFLTGD